MKNLLFLTCLTLCLFVFGQTGVYAQPPQGGRMGGGNRPMMGPPGGRMDSREPDNMIVDYFPDIPGLSLKQRTNIGNILVKEQKELDKQMQKKQQLQEKVKESSINEKKQSKIQKDTEKIDQKISQQIDKSNKKIKKDISEEQYRIFIEKRGEFQFRKMPPMRFNRDPNGPGGEMPGRMGGRPGGGRR